MSQEENILIQEVYSMVNSGHDVKMTDERRIIDKVDRKFPKSYILNYYVGMYHQKKCLADKASMYYRKCIRIQPMFVPPYFELCQILQENGCMREVEGLLMDIFDKKTLNPMSPSGAMEYNLMDNMRIASILVPHYSSSGQYKEVEYIAKKLIPRFTGLASVEYRHVEVWKNLHLTYANILNETYNNMDKAAEMYRLGLEGLCCLKKSNELDMYGNLHMVDKRLYQGYMLASNYILNPRPLSESVNSIYERYRSVDTNIITEPIYDEDGNQLRKIRIGYMSPDFNKNAVGLFCTALMKYYNPQDFEVYVYYTNDAEDEFTALFRLYISNWNNIKFMDRNTAFHLIRNIHKVDILVDLIAGGIGSQLELVAMKPAPVIINYLGFPDVCRLREITHRITDKIADVATIQKPDEERLVYMPRCFICYTLFENIKLPDIAYKNRDEPLMIYIGVMNRLGKHSNAIRTIWKMILKERKNLVLCIKLSRGETTLPGWMYSDFPKEQLKLLPFTDNLPDYLEQFNQLDFCVDTYPYSGTTTTCSSLLMGVPVFTIYNTAKSHHVNNVSASIQMNCAMDRVGNVSTICDSASQYKSNIIDYRIDRGTEQTLRIERRQRFLESMDPQRFMQEYESILKDLTKSGPY